MVKISEERNRERNLEGNVIINFNNSKHNTMWLTAPEGASLVN